MSKHNRERRKWKCKGCGGAMHRELDSCLQKVADQICIKQVKFVHICAACKTMHYKEGEGLRKLTQGEIFELHLKVPKAMERLEKDGCPSFGNAIGILEIASE